MTQATDVDIRELKSAIEANSHQISDLTTAMRDGFANIDAKFVLVDTKIEANSHQISDLTTEMRVGFANVDTKFAAVDTKFATVDTKLAEIRGEIKEVRGDIKALDNKFDERTKGIGQRLDNKEFIIRSTITAVLSGLLLTFTKFLFFGLTT
jgi:peptidoglycan hydrolase CwlO-like protein